MTAKGMVVLQPPEPDTHIAIFESDAADAEARNETPPLPYSTAVIIVDAILARITCPDAWTAGQLVQIVADLTV